MRHSSNGLNGAIQIGDAAHRTALTVDTIRFYERRALLPPALRTTGRFRLYTADDVNRLNFIKQMQGLGFSLQPIKQLLDLRDRGRYACEVVRDLLKDKLIEVRSKITDLQKLESDLATDLRKCTRELKFRQSHAPRQCPVLTVSDRRK
jgi:MerR family mercuric resistance operon transcriptional regulator